jgi:hypothetical protein
MPRLEKIDPNLKPGALERRGARMGTVLSVARATMPGQMVLRLRRVAADMGELATDSNAPAPDRISAAKALVGVQAQLLDLIGWSKRPASSPGNKRQAPMLDVSPGSPNLPDLES